MKLVVILTILIFSSSEAGALNIACNCTSNGKIPCNTKDSINHGQELDRICADDNGKKLIATKVKCNTPTGLMVCCAKAKADDPYWTTVAKDPDISYCKI